MESTRVTTVNNWFSLAKSAVWVIGLVAVLSMKISSIDSINTRQDEQITKTEQEIKALKSSFDAIKDKQVDQLVMLTRVLTLVEQGSNNNTAQDTKHKGAKNE